MHSTSLRRSALTALALALALTACSFNNGYVVDVAIDGGDRTVAAGAPLVLTVTVAHGGGATDRVTWHSSAEAVATVDADGVMVSLAVGTTDLTATSVSDPSKSDTITLTVVEAPSVGSVAISGGDRTLVLGSPLSLTATVVTAGGADPSVTWSSSDESVATIDANGAVTTLAAGATDLTATSITDPSKSDTITLTVTDPPGVVRWARQFGTPDIDRAWGVATSADGRVYLTGTTSGDLAASSAGGADIFLRAYDADGDHLWTRQFGTPFSDEAEGVATGTDGRVYIVGTTSGDLDGSRVGNLDAFVRAYDADGDHLWTRQFGTSSSDEATGVATGANGHVYVLGHTFGDLAGSSAGGADGFLRAYDADGEHLWTRQFGTPTADYVMDVATGTDGRVYLTGTTLGDLAGSNAGGVDAFVRAYDADGEHLWTRQFGTPTYDSAEGVATGTDGRVYVAGTTLGGLDGSSAGNFDTFVRAYDADGEHLGTHQFGTAGADRPSGVATGTNGHVYVTGHTTADLEGSSAGSIDAFVRAYDADGEHLWTRQFGTASAEYATGVATGTNDHAYVVGYTAGDLDGPNDGNADAFIRAYSP